MTVVGRLQHLSQVFFGLLLPSLSSTESVEKFSLVTLGVPGILNAGPSSSMARVLSSQQQTSFPPRWFDFRAIELEYQIALFPPTPLEYLGDQR